VKKLTITSSENILRILYSYNPWWREGYFPQDLSKPVKRMAYYKLVNLLNHPTIRRYLILSGARRVGKTTILYQLIESLLRDKVHPKKILYVSFDHPLFKLCSFDQILSLYELNINQSEEAYVFLDEIQYASDWDRWLKVYYDTKPKWKVVATGSASPELIEGVKESGVGRWTVVSVPTLSFYEFCEILGAEERPKDLPHLDLRELSNFNRTFRKKSPSCIRWR
jgi:predicted AAA+ superfamily ATPase